MPDTIYQTVGKIMTDAVVADVEREIEGKTAFGLWLYRMQLICLLGIRWRKLKDAVEGLRG